MGAAPVKHRYRLIAGIPAAMTLGLDALLFLARHGPEYHNATGWMYTPGFFAALGFLGTAALVGLAKGLGELGLSRSEDYYRER